MPDLLKKEHVIPDVLEDFTPSVDLHVSYGDHKVDYGNILTPTQMQHLPTVTWPAEKDTQYTLCMTDPDAPSRKDPKFREWHHWLVVNIPGSDISKGKTLSEYIGSGPPKGTGHHRYVFVLYKQPGHISPDEKHLTNRSGANRGKFSIRKFAQKYNLGHPVAARFCQAEWDDYVPKLYAQLGE